MLRTLRLLHRFSNIPQGTTSSAIQYPAAPKLLPGQLQQFRYEREKQILYEGYNQQELFGIKYGVKHSKEMKTQMMKDTVAMFVLFGVGFGLIVYNHQIFRKNMVLYKRYINSNNTRDLPIPEHAKTYPGVRKDVDPNIIHQRIWN